MLLAVSEQALLELEGVSRDDAETVELIDRLCARLYLVLDGWPAKPS